MNKVVIKRRNLNTDMDTGKTPYEYEGRDWGDASKNQGCHRLLKKTHQKPGETYVTDSLS